MTTPDHDESKPRRRWPAYLAVVLVLLLLYSLSIGPAYVLLGYFPDFVPIYNTIYCPLVVATQAEAARLPSGASVGILPP